MGRLAHAVHGPGGLPSHLSLRALQLLHEMGCRFPLRTLVPAAAVSWRRRFEEDGPGAAAAVASYVRNDQTEPPLPDCLTYMMGLTLSVQLAPYQGLPRTDASSPAVALRLRFSVSSPGQRSQPQA